MQFSKQTEHNIMDSNFSILDRIIEGKHIKPVYQPIVSLINGETYGYEALSRISEKNLDINIEQMFRIADKTNRSWELETLCRTKALENSVNLEEGKKLFLNVNSNIIYDKKFKEGFTKERLVEYDLNSNDIIFEITERTAVIDSTAFLASIEHYKNQNYSIALDDVGDGYSGLNTIANASPNMIKLNMSLIRDIDKDETKQLLCKAMVDFCKSTNIKLIAEGIEKEEELETLIKLKVDLGQGYFLGIPQDVMINISSEKIKLIKKYNEKNYSEKARCSVYPIIGYLSKPGYTFPPDEKVENIYEMFKINPTITEFTIVDNGVAIGFMTKAKLYELFGSMYGFSLYSKNVIGQLTSNEFLRVNYNMLIDKVSRLAMQRPFESLYDPVVVEKDGKYTGIVTIKDLLNACTQVEVNTAMHSNPLTGLPGNLLIEKEILSHVLNDDPYCIIYFDIDNFKAYNDAYCFQNGDLMLELLSDVLKECSTNNEFIGHIGGDDFIVICDYHDGEDYCKSVINKFSERVTSLYHDEDVKNGYIISKNRHGVTENFPIASLSVAGISNRKKSYKITDDFSKDIAELKKKCKSQIGNYYEII